MSDACDQVIEAINSAQHLLVLTHGRPDGDALGSSFALQLSLIGLGKQVDFALLSEPAERYEFLLARHVPIRMWQNRVHLADYDLVVIVDTCSYGQLDGLADQLDACRDRIAVVDHHVTRDPIGRLRWFDERAPSCGSMVHAMIRRAGWPMDLEIAEAIFIALATDTGWFRFSNTTPKAMRLGADLLEMGISVDGLYQRVYQSETAEHVALATTMMSGLELCADGRVAVATLTQEMFRRTKAHSKDTEGLIDLPQQIASVIVTVLMVERPVELGGGVRLSFRSKRDVDVNALAKRFGGGGHVRAAGAKVLGTTLEALKAEIVAACGALLPPVA